jgi:Flp pilus assembly pilin Flp
VSVLLSLWCRAVVLTTHAGDTRRESAETGQASVEYALVLLGAAVVASLLIAWASKTKLFDDLFDHILGLVKDKAK